MKLLAPYLCYWEEIRYRLGCCLLLFMFLFALLLYNANALFSFLLIMARRYQVNPTPMVVFSLWDSLQSILSMSAFVAMALTLPVLAWHIYRFVMPALYSAERQILMVLLLSALVLFYTGGALAWYYGLPMLLRALTLWLPSEALWVLEMPSFVQLVLLTVGYGGLIAQFPIVLIALCYYGWLSYAQLYAARGMVWVMAFIMGMLLTPPDMFMQILVALPLCLLYESVLLCMYCYNKLERAQQPSTLVKI